jgi:hypothetical protein
MTASFATLGLDHLPSRVGTLAAGMIYCLACDQQAVRLPIVAAALSASLQAGKKCALLTAASPGMFLRKARLAGFALEPHVKAGALTLFQMAGDTGKHLFRIGPESFLRELEQNFPGQAAFLVFDPADAIFMLPDLEASEEAAQQYLEWVSAHEHTLLATFSPAPTAARDYLTLRHIAENFAGFAVARSADGGAVLEIRHWFSAEGASPRESFALRSHASGELRVWSPSAHMDDLPPVESVIFVRGVVDHVAPNWRSWQEAESIAEAVDAARTSEAATLLLPFEKPGDYEVLCRATVTVRAMGRPSLRIVVRERQMRLRASQQLALMRLGASSIVPADLSDSSTKRMIDSLYGTRFVRAYDMDAQQVDEETSGLLRRAVTSATSFCDAVERLLAASDDFDIDSCLVRLEFGGFDPSGVVNIARRLGRDLVAFAHRDSAWLFVFGCPKSMAPAMLERLFRTGGAEACTKWSTEHDPERILMLLNELREEAAASEIRAPAASSALQ